jgi:hypothetical protein
MTGTFLLFAAALQAAPAPPDAAPRPQPSTWTYETPGGARVLRGATLEDPGDRIIFMCNNEHRLIAMLFRLGGDPQAIAERATSGQWLVDGVAQPEVDPRPVIPMNAHTVSLALVEPAFFRRLIAANAAGFVWRGGDGAPLAGYQIDTAGGRAQLVEFARACDAEAYR